jgi:hypothetical protein
VSELEDKLRALSFHQPPHDLRAQVLSGLWIETSRSKCAGPRPAAWGALVAIWIALLVLNRLLDDPLRAQGYASLSVPLQSQAESVPTLFALHVRAATGQPAL